MHLADISHKGAVMRVDLARRLVAEGLGTAFLLAAVVGSGIMADRLCGGNVGLALLCNALATGGVLAALILTFGSVSGAHFNPVVTLADAALESMPWRDVPAYAAAQVVGAVFGVAVADLMFELPAFSFSTHVRTGAAQWLAEVVATFGLVATIHGVSRRSPAATPFAVGAYIVGAYWFTASTSFANPAVTLARSLTNTFAGIRPTDVAGFVVAQLVGGGLATVVLRWLVPVAVEVPRIVDRNAS
jgi:glycerol uptake facilitator-like aquaporin